MTIFLKNESSFSMVIWKNIQDLLELLAVACMQVKKTEAIKRQEVALERAPQLGTGDARAEQPDPVHFCDSASSSSVSP